MPYADEIERILRVGFETAMKRRNKADGGGQANVLDTSACGAVAAWPGTTAEVNYMYVDNASCRS